MTKYFIAALCGLAIGAVLVFYGMDSQVKELEVHNDILKKKLKESDE